MKSKIIFILHLVIRKFHLEFFVFLITKISKISSWKALPQNIHYKFDDNIKIYRNEVNFFVNRNDFTQWQIYANYPELHYEAFLNNYKKGNVIDVGSNIGSFSLLVANYLKKIKSDYKVYAFEPYFEIYSKLKKNLDINPGLSTRIVIENTALSEKIDEKMKFEIINHNLGANFLKKINNDNNEKNDKILTTDTLDNYCFKKNISNIRFIKIDVEGMELEVLNGSESIIEQFEPSIFIEVNENKYREKNLSFEPYLNKFSTKNKKFFTENKISRKLEEKSLKEVLSILRERDSNFNLLIT